MQAIAPSLVIEPSSEIEDESRSRVAQTSTDRTTEAPLGDPVNKARMLPIVCKTIAQQQLQAYAQASGDWNPIHLDAEFAATTRFGGIIAHGMLTLAFVSELMTAAFDKAWLESGSLRVRFKGAAYVGDRIEAGGRVTKEEPHLRGNKIECAVTVTNEEFGRELVSGTANVILANS